MGWCVPWLLPPRKQRCLPYPVGVFRPRRHASSSESDRHSAPQQRADLRARHPADGVRPRLRLRPEHVALPHARLRGRLPHRPLRLRRLGQVGPQRLPRRPLRRPQRLRRGRAGGLRRARPPRHRVRRPQREQHDRRARVHQGARAVRAARARRPLAALHQRGARLRRRLRAGRHRGLCCRRWRRTTSAGPTSSRPPS